MEVAAAAAGQEIGLPAREQFRALMRRFPSGVSVVTAVDRHGVPHGMTCTSLSSVTLEPPTLLVCLNAGSGTLAAIRDQGRFGVNLLHENGILAARVFSTFVEDRFAQVPWRPSPGDGQPWLYDHAFALAECEVDDTMLVGDHLVIVGRVRGVSQEDGLPLLYGLQRFARWPGDP